MEQLIFKIKQWGIDRDIDTGNSLIQTTKTLEEVIELQQAICNNQKLETKDAIGDIFVTLVMICLQEGMDIKDCIEYSYNEIKDRKGKLINDLWVKEK